MNGEGDEMHKIQRQIPCPVESVRTETHTQKNKRTLQGNTVVAE